MVEASHRLDSINTRETLMAQAYGDLYSPKDSPASPGFRPLILEETDTAAKALEQPQRMTELANSREHTPPNQLKHDDHTQEQHVHFNFQIDKTEKGLTAVQFKTNFLQLLES